MHPALGGVSVGHALDMTGGLPDTMETLWLLGVPITAAIGRDALLRFVTSLDAANFPPGTELSYSNTGYRLIEAALAAKGVDYETALRDRFFAPLGLSIRLAEDWRTPIPNLAAGYWRGPRGWERGSYGMHFSASGGLAGSAGDLAVWAQALLADRAPGDGCWIACRRRATWPTDARAATGSGSRWSHAGGRALVGHNGSLPGYKNHFLLDPEAREGVVVLTNREDTDAHDIALRVMAALHDAALPAAVPPMRCPRGVYAPIPGRSGCASPAGARNFWARRRRCMRRPTAGLRRARPRGRCGCGWRDGAIEAEIGHAARRFRAVPADAACGPRLVGRMALSRAGRALRDRQGRYGLRRRAAA